MPTSSSPVTQWVHLTIPPGEWSDDFLPAVNEHWNSAMQVLRDQPGCHKVLWSRWKESRENLWLLVDWRNDEYLHDFQISQDAHHTFATHLRAIVQAPPTVRSHLFYPLANTLGQGLIPPAHPSDPIIHELVQCYFPTNLPLAIKRPIEGIYSISSLSDMGDDQVPALMGTNRGWWREEVKWNGQPAQAFVWVFRWRSEEDEKRFKVEEKTGKRNAEEGLQLAVEAFFDEMRRFGMIGYESQHCYFKEQ